MPPVKADDEPQADKRHDDGDGNTPSKGLFEHHNADDPQDEHLEIGQQGRQAGAHKMNAAVPEKQIQGKTRAANRSQCRIPAPEPREPLPEHDHPEKHEGAEKHPVKCRQELTEEKYENRLML